MSGNNNIPNGLNKIAENEYNYSETSDKEINDLSEEFSVAADNSSADVKEYASLKGKTETVAGSLGSVAKQSTATTEAVNAASANTSVFYRIVMSLAAVFGALVIGTSYIPAARAEDAKFIDVSQYEREISIELEVIKWSEDLKVRITGKDFTDYLEIENREEDADYPSDNQGDWYDEEREKERNYRWLYYYVENAEDGDEILLEIIGSTFMMSDVIDSKTVVLKFEEKSEYDYADDNQGNYDYNYSG